MSSLGQILARIEEVGRAQAEERRLFFEARLGPPARWLNPGPQYRAVLRATSEPQEPSEASTSEAQEPSDLRTAEPQQPSEGPTFEPSEVRIPEVQELQNPEVQEPVELPTTPVSRGPSAEGRPWFPVTRRRLLIPGARRRCPLPLPRLHPGQPQLPVPLPQRPVATEPQRPVPVTPEPPRPGPPEPPRPVPPEPPPPVPSSPEPRLPSPVPVPQSPLPCSSSCGGVG
ncbi:hypothetical protein EYF80_060809 [Liparis tanakae]|uniref:Uncharacterized protein n=1 Tax=Liparis tanakae TaxID=230148 RepID=A0A4Z2EJP4_9TELE|nr:hypothetical protein EYF80_060809 [Liparis tanakae]